MDSLQRLLMKSGQIKPELEGVVYDTAEQTEAEGSGSDDTCGGL